MHFGESGKGKTTLLKLIQGFELPDEGEIWVDGELLGEESVLALRNKMVWIPQNIHLPVANGEKLLELLELNNHQDQVAMYLQQLGLPRDILKKDFAEISGGQKQRIIIAICLCIERPIIMMDEPTSSLDETSIHLLLETLRGLKNKTIISASHNKTWMKQADSIIAL